MIEYVEGDLIQMAKEGHFNAIAHGCNCFHVFGSGVAAQIKESFPEAYSADKNTVWGDRSKLGNYSNNSALTQTGGVFRIYNLYTQFNYGKTGRHLDYEALAKALEKLNFLVRADLPFGIPKIGCGLAGGDWKIVSTMIESILPNHNITVVIKE